MSGPILHLWKMEMQPKSFKMSIWMKKKHFKMASQETLCPQDLVDQGRQENQLPAIGEESKRNGR